MTPLFFNILNCVREIDLPRIKAKDPVAAAAIAAALSEFEANPKGCDFLLQQMYGEKANRRPHHRFGARWLDKWFIHGRPKRAIWRFKVWKLESQGKKYRVVYGYFAAAGQRRIIVLGVFERSWNYANGHPYTVRVLADFDRMHAKYGS
ncbi:hypothetical protein ACFFGH_06470 [Lysobacter korlensis]|uniref:Toxin YhaV n=1 Tax=Lysobacter korlensis TaxID=553636 RepID=A0ABV6RKK0_9GAMM